LVIFDESLTENLPKARLAFPVSSIAAATENGPGRAKKVPLDALLRITASAGLSGF
jgi:hypothetical protein